MRISFDETLIQLTLASTQELRKLRDAPMPPPLEDSPKCPRCSLAYSVLTRTWSATLQGIGFDPYLGFYHQPRPGRTALALDMMEPFRPVLADSAVITAINNGEVTENDFLERAGSRL